MAPVEELREAARLMRERANAATPGPWVHTGRNHIETPTIEVDEANWGGEGLHGYSLACIEDSAAWRIADAEHIASWHPAVALAVAGWLDNVVRHFESVGLTERAHALTVARAYLGGGS